MKKNNKKGFTLVELVIVVAVMAVLVAVAIPVIGNITNSAQNAVDDSNARAIESMIKMSEAKLSSKEVAAIDDADDNVTYDSNGDGTAEEFTYASFVDAELEAAKLGITNKTFYYDISTGNCSWKTDNLVTGDLQIAFGTDGTVEVTKYTAAGATSDVGSSN